MTTRRTLLRFCVSIGVVGLAGCAEDADSYLPIGDSQDPYTAHSTDAIVDGGRPAGWSRDGYDAVASSAVATSDAAVDWLIPAWGIERAEEVVSPQAPIVFDGAVIRAFDNGLTAFDADGSVRWDISLSSPRMLTVVGRTVYTATRNGLAALSTDDGDTYWRFYPGGDPANAEQPRNHRLFAGATVHDDVVYTPGSTVPLHALDAETGEPQWAYETEYDIHGENGTNEPGQTKPTVVDDTVFVGTGPRLHAVDVADGSERWIRELERAPTHSAVVADPSRGLLYVHLMENRSDGYSEIRALDIDDGHDRWTYTATGDGLIHTRPAFADGVLYFADGDRFRAVEVDTDGTNERWTINIDVRFEAAPTVAGEYVYVPIAHESLDEVAMLRTDDGDHHASVWAAGEPLGQPVVADDRLYLNWDSGIAVYEEGSRPEPASTGRWSMHNGDRYNSAFASTSGLAEPTVDWIFSGGSTMDPVLLDGVMFVGNGGVDAVDATSGQRLWRVPDLGVGQLATDGKRLFCTSAAESAVVAADAKTGERDWSYELEADPGGGPIVTDGTVVACDEEGRVYGLSADSGEAHGISNRGRATYTLAARDGHALATNNNGRLTAINYETGDGRDSVFLDDPYPMRGPAIGPDRDLYIVQNAGAVHSFEWTEFWTFEDRWQYEPEDPGNNVADPVVDDQYVYASYSDGSIYALDRSDGEAGWSLDLPDNRSGTLAIAGDVLYAAHDEYLFAFDPSTGDERWRIELEGDNEFGTPVDEPSTRSVAIGEDGVYVSSMDGVFKVVEN